MVHFDLLVTTFNERALDIKDIVNFDQLVTHIERNLLHARFVWCFLTHQRHLSGLPCHLVEQRS